MLDIDKLILTATKEQNTVKKDTYRLIKAKFLEYKTSKTAITKPFNDEVELTILRKMKKELEEDIDVFRDAKIELAEEYNNQLNIVKELLPAEVSEEEILKCIDEYIANNGPISQKQFGLVMKTISADHPSADKGLISKLIKSKI